MTIDIIRLQIPTPVGSAQVELNEGGFTAVRFVDLTTPKTSGNRHRICDVKSVLEAEPMLRDYAKKTRVGILQGLESLLELQWADRLPLVITGTPFQISVWDALARIPSGCTHSYRWLAHAIGKPHATRAVANACGANPLAYFIPCHRIIRSDGQLGGYRWGIETKRFLIERESSQGNLALIL